MTDKMPARNWWDIESWRDDITLDPTGPAPEPLPYQEAQPTLNRPRKVRKVKNKASPIAELHAMQKQDQEPAPDPDPPKPAPVTPVNEAEQVNSDPAPAPALPKRMPGESMLEYTRRLNDAADPAWRQSRLDHYQDTLGGVPYKARHSGGHSPRGRW